MFSDIRILLSIVVAHSNHGGSGVDLWQASRFIANFPKMFHQRLISQYLIKYI